MAVEYSPSDTASRGLHPAATKLLETDNSGDADSPMVATDPNGNALVVWEAFDGTHMNAWSIKLDY